MYELALDLDGREGDFYSIFQALVIPGVHPAASNAQRLT